jgi:hypothetical protein
MTSGLEAFLQTKANGGDLSNLKQSEIDQWTDLYNSSRSLQERYGDLISGQQNVTQVIEQQVTITPEYSVTDVPVPDITPKLEDLTVNPQVTLIPDYTVLDAGLPDTVPAISDKTLTQPVTIMPEYQVQEITMSDLPMAAQAIIQPVTITPEYLVKEVPVPDIPALPDITRTQMVAVIPEYDIRQVSAEIELVLGNIEQISRITIIPEYSVSDVPVPDIIPDVTDKEVIQHITVRPEYEILETMAPDITGIISDKTITQPVTIVPEYNVIDTALPDLLPVIGDKTITQPVTINPEYNVSNVPVPDIIPDVTYKEITQPVLITPEYSIEQVNLPSVIDTIIPDIQKIAIPVTIEPVINLIDTLTGSASMITQAFRQSALNIEVSFGEMIEAVKSRVDTLSESIKTAVSTDNNQTQLARSVPAGGQAQPAITNHNTYQNYFTVQGTTDVRKLAEEVARILDRGAKSHRI